jgi:hypothetical protein
MTLRRRKTNHGRGTVDTKESLKRIQVLASSQSLPAELAIDLIYEECVKARTVLSEKFGLKLLKRLVVVAGPILLAFADLPQ